MHTCALEVKVSLFSRVHAPCFTLQQGMQARADGETGDLDMRCLEDMDDEEIERIAGSCFFPVSVPSDSPVTDC